MEQMTLIGLVQYGTPVVLLGLIILNVYQAVIIGQLQRDFHEFKGGVTHAKQCNERHDHIDTRLDRLERKICNEG